MVESPTRIVAEQLVEVLGSFDLNGIGREIEDSKIGTVNRSWFRISRTSRNANAEIHTAREEDGEAGCEDWIPACDSVACRKSLPQQSELL